MVVNSVALVSSSASKSCTPKSRSDIVFSSPLFLPRLPTDASKPIKIDLPISHAGAFVYWVEYDGIPTASDSSPSRIKGREGYFNIDPILKVKKRTPILDPVSLKTISVSSGGGAFVTPPEDVAIPLDGIAMLTVVSKWMGPLSEWAPHLNEARERGYNMLHYTPLQQRGVSLSPYSIADQMAFDSALFDPDFKGSKEDGVKLVWEALKVAKDKYGLMSMTDVVLNHTANNSDWLQDHPEAGESLEPTSPTWYDI